MLSNYYYVPDTAYPPRAISFTLHNHLTSRRPIAKVTAEDTGDTSGRHVPTVAQPESGRTRRRRSKASKAAIPVGAESALPTSEKRATLASPNSPKPSGSAASLQGLGFGHATCLRFGGPARWSRTDRLAPGAHISPPVVRGRPLPHHAHYAPRKSRL